MNRCHRAAPIWLMGLLNSTFGIYRGRLSNITHKDNESVLSSGYNVADIGTRGMMALIAAEIVHHLPLMFAARGVRRRNYFPVARVHCHVCNFCRDYRAYNPFAAATFSLLKASATVPIVIGAEEMWKIASKDCWSRC